MSTSETGDRGSLRLAVHGEYAQASSLLIRGDLDRRIGTTVSLGFTPHRKVEVFAAGSAQTNRNQKGPQGESQTDFQGIFVIGAKVIVPVGRAFFAGAELGLRVPTAWSWLVEAASGWIGVLCSFDLKQLSALPLKGHASAAFYEDNSRRQYAFTGLSASDRQAVAFAHELGASRVRMAFGIDALLEPSTGPIAWRPFAEYHWELVTADPDPAFLDQGPFNRDQHWVTLGLRARIAVDVTIDAGVDVLVHDVGFAFGPSLPPYNVFLGASVPFNVLVGRHK